MLTGLTVQELGVLARNGASLDVDGTKLPPVELCELARNMTRDSVLTVHNSNKIPMHLLAQIARASGISHVRFK